MHTKFSLENVNRQKIGTIISMKQVESGGLDSSG
jgi:hypothetical protein